MNFRKNLNDLGFGRYLSRSLMAIGVSPNFSFYISKTVKTLISPLRVLRSLYIGQYLKSKPKDLSISKTDHFLLLEQGTIPGVGDIVTTVNSYYKKHKASFHRLQNDHYTYLVNPMRPGSKESFTQYEKELIRSILRFASHPALMGIAAEYIGKIPIFHGYSLTHVRENSVSGELKGAQNFHRDVGENKLLHLLVMITEGTDENGPFCFIPGNFSVKVTKALGHQNGRVTDKEVFEYVSESELVKFTGQPGKALFLNPSKCWHYGARTKSKDRLSLIISYAPLNEPIEGITCLGLKKYSSWLVENDLSKSEKHLLGIF